METPDTLHDFWFGSSTDDAIVAQERAELWWIKKDDIDKLIQQRFAAYVQKAASNELDAWAVTPLGRLALILLTDQFPRNIYRNTPQSFACDVLALAWCKEGLQANVQIALRPIERVFFYLPLEHSESLHDQEMAVALFQELVDRVDPSQKSVFEGFLDYAVRHHQIIARFGRFPHRNQILGRASSPEELAFLQEPGSSF